MCGRYVSPEQAEIERFWHIGRHNNNPFQRRFNVSPTQIIPILRLDRETGEIELVNARWGLIPNWWKDAKPPRTSHNARAEEAATKPMWKGPLSRSRCLVPAVGWYEWKTVEKPDPETGEIKTVKQPHFFHLPGNQLFSFAGLMATWKSPDRDEPVLSCTILSQGSVGPAAEVHERMPVVLTPEAEQRWLDQALTDPAAAIAAARRDAVTNILHYPVGAQVNASKNEGAELMQEQK
ncbi:MAG TPA: SOS response-associated peptidase [Burkholderiales bacterium]|nr:SOS response-associated peptidase [Burkholderiales bacterium]